MLKKNIFVVKDFEDGDVYGIIKTHYTREVIKKALMKSYDEWIELTCPDNFISYFQEHEMANLGEFIELDDDNVLCI